MDNISYDRGGVILGDNHGVLVSVYDSWFEYNRALEGGVFYGVELSRFEFTNTTFLNNLAGQSGVGGLTMESGSSFTNCSFIGNRAI